MDASSRGGNDTLNGGGSGDIQRDHILDRIDAGLIVQK
jgi:hypothetical protein